MDAARKLFALKKAEAKAARKRLRLAGADLLPSSLKLHILDWLERDIWFNSYSQPDSVGVENWRTELVGRFRGDSDRRAVLLHRTLRISVYSGIEYAFDHRDPVLAFILKRTRYLCVDNDERSFDVPERVKPALAALLSGSTLRLLPRLRELRLICCIDDRRLSDFACSKVTMFTIGVMRSVAPELGRMPRLRLLHTDWRSVEGLAPALRVNPHVSRVHAYVNSSDELGQLLNITSITELRSFGSSVITLRLLHESRPLSHLRCFTANYAGVVVDRISRFANVSTLCFHLSRETSSSKIFEGVSLLPHLRELSVCFVAFWIVDVHACGAEEIVRCTELRELFLGHVRRKDDPLRDQFDAMARGWIDSVLTPMILDTGRINLTSVGASGWPVKPETLRSWCNEGARRLLGLSSPSSSSVASRRSVWFEDKYDFLCRIDDLL